MTPERWQQVKAIFNSAINYRPEEREVFISQACSGDDALRSEVESLIASHERSGRFIDDPAFHVAASLLADDKSELKPGQTIGSYEVVSFLSRGGMGEVYVAEDKRLGRKVALKLLPSSFTKDDDRLRRFEQEARAASALNHPNIITIYEIRDAGSSHVIATEFVEGETLRTRLNRGALSVSERQAKTFSTRDFCPRTVPTCVTPSTLRAINPVDIPDALQQYSGTIGGPIVRDRTFFFATADYTRQNRTTFLSTSLPAFVLPPDGNLAYTGHYRQFLLDARVDHKLTSNQNLAVRMNVDRFFDDNPQDALGAFVPPTASCGLSSKKRSTFMRTARF